MLLCVCVLVPICTFTDLHCLHLTVHLMLSVCDSVIRLYPTPVCFQCRCVCVLSGTYVRAGLPVNSLTASAIRPLWTVTESSESSALVHCWRAMMDGCVWRDESSHVVAGLL